MRFTFCLFGHLFVFPTLERRRVNSSRTRYPKPFVCGHNSVVRYTGGIFLAKVNHPFVNSLIAIGETAAPAAETSRSDPIWRVATGAPRVCVVGLRGIPDVSGGIETHCEYLLPKIADLNPDEQFVVIGRRPSMGGEILRRRGNLTVVPLFAMKNRFLETISNTFVGVLKARMVYNCRIVHLHAVGPALLAPVARLLGAKVVFTIMATITNAPNGTVRCSGSSRPESASASPRRIASSRCRLARRPAQGRIPAQGRQDSLHPQRRRSHPRRERAWPSQSRCLACPVRAVGGAVHRLGRAAGAGKGLCRSDRRLCAGQTEGQAGHRRWPERVVARSGDPRSDRGVRARAGRDPDRCDPARGGGGAAVAAELFVLASHHEGLPIAALEASAMGAPLVLSDIQPNRDLGLPEAHYVPVGQPEALAEALAQDGASFRAPDLIKRFNWARIAEETDAVYAALEEA